MTTGNSLPNPSSLNNSVESTVDHRQCEHIVDIDMQSPQDEIATSTTTTIETHPNLNLTPSPDPPHQITSTFVPIFGKTDDYLISLTSSLHPPGKPFALVSSQFHPTLLRINSILMK